MPGPQKLNNAVIGKKLPVIIPACFEQRHAEINLLNSVQEGLSSRMEMPDIYNLVGDKLRDTFNAQIVMISQYDPQTQENFPSLCSGERRPLAPDRMVSCGYFPGKDRPHR